MAASWGSETDGDALTLTSSWQFLESGGASADIEIQMAPNQELHAQINYNPQASPTDSAEIQVLASTDGTNYDDTPVLAFAMANTPDPHRRSFTISGYYSLQFQARQTGSTDTTSTATMSWRVATLS